MRDHDDMPAELGKATELLRDLPDVRDEWRRDLQVKIDADDPGVWSRAAERIGDARWSMRPVTAIAAALLCALGGALVTNAVRGSRATNVSTAMAPNDFGVLPVKFDLVAPTATAVTIAGDFNRWNPASLPMHRSADGRTWEVEVRLPPGRYTYGFVVDGHLTRDPSAPQSSGDDFGIPNSVLMVSGKNGTT